MTEQENQEIKRGPGRPRKQETRAGLMIDPKVFEAITQEPNQPPPHIILPIGEPADSAIKAYAEKIHPTQSLGDLYTAIDAAPPEWLPSLLAKVVKTSLKSGAWSDVENLILSVRGFLK